MLWFTCFLVTQVQRGSTLFIFNSSFLFCFFTTLVHLEIMSVAEGRCRLYMGAHAHKLTRESAHGFCWRGFPLFLFFFFWLLVLCYFHVRCASGVIARPIFYWRASVLETRRWNDDGHFCAQRAALWGVDELCFPRFSCLLISLFLQISLDYRKSLFPL